MTVEQLEDRCVPSTITVTGNGDGFGTFTKTGPASYTASTLRRAILEANARPGPNTINFNIPGAPVITPRRDLPVIRNNQITIDGTTQPGYDATNFIPVVTIDGSFDVKGGNGFLISGNNNVLEGLIIVNFSSNGIWMRGRLDTKLKTFKGGSGNQVIDDFIGTDGDSALGNGTGVRIQNAGNNIIGGMADSQRDVISDNSSAGVLIATSNFNQIKAIHQFNQVVGNYIGTNIAGTGRLGRQRIGVSIEGGDTNYILSNVISGNEVGVNVTANLAVTGAAGRHPDSIQNQIQSNVIGLDKAGEKKIGNQFGIIVAGSGSAVENLIGGDQPAQGNIVSGNEQNIQLRGGSNGTQVFGNFIGTDSLGQTVFAGTVVGVRIADSSNNQVGGSERGQANVISGDGIGVSIINMDTTGNQVLNNIIGLSSTGGDLGSSQQIGVNIDNSPGNDLVDNVISGNVTGGVRLAGNAAEENVLTENRIGTDLTGTEAVGSQGYGVLLTQTANDNFIGPEPSQSSLLGNTISGNDVGIKVLLAGTTLNQISFNYIGTDLSGSAAVPNKKYGVLLDSGAADNTVSGNVISGNGWSGIGIFDRAGGAVESNLIGTDADGTIAIPNGPVGKKLTLPEQGNGIIIDNSFQNSVTQNVVSGNLADGILINGPQATLNVLTQNIIGLNNTGTSAVPNGKNGVEISSGATKNTIGGAGLDNVISGNSGNGISVTRKATKNQILENIIGLDSDGLIPMPNLAAGVHLGTGATGNTIQKSEIWFNTGAGVRDENPKLSNFITQNSIYQNGGLGIDLGPQGVTLLSIPLFTGAHIVGNELELFGSLLNAQANTRFVIEFFDNQQPDPSGYGEGQTYLGSTTVTTNAAGSTSFITAFPASAIRGGYITATATDAKGTSEFSAWITPGSINPTQGTPQGTIITNNFFTPLQATVTGSNGRAEAGVTVTFQAPTSGSSGTFANGLTSVQVVTDSNGVATAPAFTANQLAGSYIVTASIGGSSAKADFVLTNDLAPTGTFVISDNNPSGGLGDPVTFTAFVAGPAASYGNPTGPVEFFDNNNTLLGTGTLAIVNGFDEASFTTSSLALGTHFMYALYEGDNNFLASASPILTQIVGIQTQTTIASSAPVSVTGQDVTFSSNVTTLSGQPVTVGDVEFLVSFPDGTNVPLGTVPLDANGQAQLGINFLLPPGNEIFASYLGSGNYLNSPSDLLNQVVSAADTSLSLVADSSTVTVGQPDNMTSTLGAVSPGSFVVTPTGTTSVYQSFNGGAAVLIGQFPVGGSLSTPAFSVPGEYTIYDVYTSGDGNYNGTTSNSVTITVVSASSAIADPPSTLASTLAPGFNPLASSDAEFAAYFLALKQHGG